MLDFYFYFFLNTIKKAADSAVVSAHQIKPTPKIFQLLKRGRQNLIRLKPPCKSEVVTYSLHTATIHFEGGSAGEIQAYNSYQNCQQKK